MNWFGRLIRMRELEERLDRELRDWLRLTELLGLILEHGGGETP